MTSIIIPAVVVVAICGQVSFAQSIGIRQNDAGYKPPAKVPDKNPEAPFDVLKFLKARPPEYVKSYMDAMAAAAAAYPELASPESALSVDWKARIYNTWLEKPPAIKDGNWPLLLADKVADEHAAKGEWIDSRRLFARKYSQKYVDGMEASMKEFQKTYIYDPTKKWGYSNKQMGEAAEFEREYHTRVKQEWKDHKAIFASPTWPMTIAGTIAAEWLAKGKTIAIQPQPQPQAQPAPVPRHGRLHLD